MSPPKAYDRKALELFGEFAYLNFPEAVSRWVRDSFNLTYTELRFRLCSVLVIGKGYDMGISEILGDKKDQILALAAKHGAFNVRVFGSVAEGTADEQSDIDFLVDMEKDRSLFDLGGLLMDLQDLLGRKVDVVTEKALHWYIKERVLNEAKPI